MSRHSRASGSKNQSRSNREESEQPRNEVRSNYAAISCPQNFLNPFSIFKGFMSGELKEAEQNMFPALSTFNYFKRINEVMYDKNRKVVTAYLENDPIWATTSWTEVVENFGREQAENMLECSKLIDAFGSSMEKLSKLSEQMKSTGIKTDNDARKSDFDKMRTKSEKEFPCFYLKNVIKRHNPTFIEYNTQLLNFLGYNPSEFASNLLRHGIPELYPNVQKKYASMVKEIVEILVEGKHSSKPMMKEVYLLHSNLQISLVTETIYLMRSLNKDEELEIELFMTYEKVGEPQKVEEEMEAVVKPKVAAALSETAEQEKDEFLKKFYNIKKKDDSDLARTCKIRYLSD